MIRSDVDSSNGFNVRVSTNGLISTWWLESLAHRGRSNRGHPHCQIYDRFGHLAQQCYYRFDRSFDGFPASSTSRPLEGFLVASANPNVFSSHGFSSPLPYGSFSHGLSIGLFSQVSLVAQVNQVSYLPKSSGPL